MFVSSLLQDIKETPLLPFNSSKALIGAFIAPSPRYLEFLDGSAMMNGKFPDSQTVGDIYVGKNITCLNMNEQGAIESCDEGGNIQICEKSVLRYSQLCLNISSTENMTEEIHVRTLLKQDIEWKNMYRLMFRWRILQSVQLNVSCSAEDASTSPTAMLQCLTRCVDALLT